MRFFSLLFVCFLVNGCHSTANLSVRDKDSLAVLIEGDQPIFESQECIGSAQSAFVKFWIDVQGAVTDVKVLSELNEQCVDHLIEAVSQYRFKPALKDGAAVPSTLSVWVEFDVKLNPRANQ